VVVDFVEQAIELFQALVAGSIVTIVFGFRAFTRKGVAE
jgi:hypothetical protein